MTSSADTGATAREMSKAVERAGLGCAIAAARFTLARQGGGEKLSRDLAQKERQLRKLDGGRLRGAVRALVGRR